MSKIREHVYLAAMLHDIGKFYQRADRGNVSSSKFLSDFCKDESTFCPQFAGRYSHKHVLWTAQFIEDYKSVFNNLVPIDLNDLSAKDNLINLAAGHHLQAEQLSELGRIIKEADSLSSGMDRSSTDAMRDAQDEEETNWDAYKKKRMVSVMETIKSSSEKSNWMHLPIGKLNLSKSCFPKESFIQEPDYAKLWDGFVSEFKFIQADTYRAFSETMLNLLLKYASCIPASTIDFPDVSLYDHLKTTAALAVCLYDYQQEENHDSESPFLLIGADFSGIQPYIYQIVSKYAAKNLKGRSFYLKILSDAVVRYLLKELDLFQANVVYNSGGGFYLLAPNTTALKNKLKVAIETIEKKLFETHGTSLFVAIDSIELSKNALLHRDDSLGEVWGRLFKLRDKKKSAKFAQQIAENYNLFFNPSKQGGDAGRDSITGEEFLPGEKPIVKEGLKLKPINAIQIEIGKKLRDMDLVVVKDGEALPFWKDKTQITPINLGFTYYFLNDQDLTDNKEKLKGYADSISVVTMNGKNGDCDFLRTVDGINNIYSLDFYGGNESDQKQIRTFEEMCDNDSFSRLGVLRMDVDNLGSIFQSGIAPVRATLSRYAALSRSFDFFFSGYLNTIWREADPDKSFIVYSGGDDVFIVGSWDVTIRLAERIKVDFKEFSCNNPAFSISGGIAIIQPKYPIMKGADESDGEEKNAKKHCCVGADKNSLSFMDLALNWDYEYSTVCSLKDSMVRLIDNGVMPKSFISKLMIHYANAKMMNHKITVAKTFWMLTYDLSRMKSRSDSEVNMLIDNCIKEVCNKSKGTLNGKSIKTDYHPLELWAFAARWAELEYRSKQEKKNQQSFKYRYDG